MPLSTKLSDNDEDRISLAAVGIYIAVFRMAAPRNGQTAKCARRFYIRKNAKYAKGDLCRRDDRRADESEVRSVSVNPQRR